VFCAVTNIFYALVHVHILCVPHLNKQFCHATFAFLRKREEDNRRAMFTAYSTTDCVLSAC